MLYTTSVEEVITSAYETEFINNAWTEQEEESMHSQSFVDYSDLYISEPLKSLCDLVDAIDDDDITVVMDEMMWTGSWVFTYTTDIIILMYLLLCFICPGVACLPHLLYPKSMLM